MLKILSAVTLAASAGSAAQPQAPELRRILAEEARQGVASDGTYAYAIDNSRIGKYQIVDGVRVAQWLGDPTVVPHLNSCVVFRRELVCASSNYPAVPHISSIEYFDRNTLRHLRSRKLGATEGSLTTMDFHEGSWWAVFAHYDGKGGIPGKDHQSTRLARFDRNFREKQSWMLPSALLDRLKPYSISGANWSVDGKLALSGHDRSEIYLVTVPKSGRALQLDTTIPVGTHGQAIAWDPRIPGALWSISRTDRALVLTDLRTMTMTGRMAQRPRRD